MTSIVPLCGSLFQHCTALFMCILMRHLLLSSILHSRSTIPRAIPLRVMKAFEIANWDGYDAHAVTKETVQAARRLLGLIPRDFPDPDIAPGSDGGIGFEWVLENSSIRKLFIDVGPGATWSAYWRLASGARGNSPRQPIDPETHEKVAAIFHQLGVIDASGRW